MELRTRPSLLMHYACFYLARTPTKKTLGAPALVEADRVKNRAVGPAPLPKKLTKRLTTTRTSRPGLETIEVVPTGVAVERTIVYVHGGGYLNPMVAPHWDLVAALAAENRARVILPLYPLAPEGTAATVLPVLVDLHRDLTASGEGIVWAGDSAGGGLVTALAFRLKDSDLPQPEHLVLLAPWLDLEMKNPALPAVERRDPTLASAGLHYCASLWAGGTALDSVDNSPINGDPAGLPPITLFVGTRDLLVADCRDFARQAEASGVDIELWEAPGAFHVFVAGTILPESRAARGIITGRLRAAVTAPGR